MWGGKIVAFTSLLFGYEYFQNEAMRGGVMFIDT